MRALWTGNIRFGMVSMPVKMYSASREKLAKLKLLCKKHHTPVHHKNVCDKGHELKNNEIMHGIAYGKSVVGIPDEDLKRIMPFNEKLISIISFTEPYEIDELYEYKKYYLVPFKRTREFAVLKKAMEKSGLVALGKMIYRNAERYVILKPYKRILMMISLHYPAEINQIKLIAPRISSKARPEEIELAMELIERMKSNFDPSIMNDEFCDALVTYAKLKKNGKKIGMRKISPPVARGGFIELLKKSLGMVK